MTVDIRKLKYTVEVARSGSVTLAARNLNITQPALTRSIAEVEDILGLQLFQRSSKGLRTTEVGKEFVSRAQKIIYAFDDLISHLGDHGRLKTGRLRVGFASAIFQGFAASTLTEMIRRYPGIRIETLAGSGEDLVPMLVNDEVDILFGRAGHMERWSELQIERLSDLHCKIMVRKGHPLDRAQRPTAREVLAYPLAQAAVVEQASSEIRGLYSLHGLEPREPFYVSHDFNLIRRVVANSDAFSPVFNIADDFRRLSDRYVLFDNVIGLSQQTLAIATYKNKESAPPVSMFAEIAREKIGPTSSRKV